MTAEYKLKLNKVAEMKNNFLNGFSKENWKEYQYLDIEKSQLHSIEVDQIINKTIEIIVTIYSDFSKK